MTERRTLMHGCRHFFIVKHYLMNNQGAHLRPSVYRVRKLTASSDNDKLRIKIDNKNELIVEDYQSVRAGFH